MTTMATYQCSTVGRSETHRSRRAHRHRHPRFTATTPSHIKTVLLMILSGLFAVCSCTPRSPIIRVDYVEPLMAQTAFVVTNAIQECPTFRRLKERCSTPTVVVQQEVQGWVTADIGGTGKDFFSRWATLRVEVSTGRVLRLETDEKLEDKWVLDVQPKSKTSRDNNLAK